MRTVADALPAFCATKTTEFAEEDSKLVRAFLALTLIILTNKAGDGKFAG